jgi:adenosylcobinamide kinase/adenosylcobinamide-phosphate guanylyltransferase
MPEQIRPLDEATHGTALPPVTLVLGGARSGKSRFAEELIERAGQPARYLATAEPSDDEMRARIAAHRARRGGNWTTIEEPLDLVNVLLAGDARPMLIDCLTLWLANLMGGQRDVGFEIERLLSLLPRAKSPLVLVTNEVGLGIVPENALAREFRDHAGRLNQGVARLAQRVVFMAAGLPLTLKGSPA